jgi:hypothetical protein
MNESGCNNYNLKVNVVSDVGEATKKVDLLVLAAGFEERAFEVIDKGTFSSDAHCIIIKYMNSIEGNDSLFNAYLNVAHEKFPKTNICIVELYTERLGDDDKVIGLIDNEIRLAVSRLPHSIGEIAIDISGMTSYLICLVLKCIREFMPFRNQKVLYVSAKHYMPTRVEYDDLVRLQGEDIEYLPKSMALEMSKNLVPDMFGGHRSGEGNVCLIVFAGYELHRSSGTIDNINPSLLLLLYGDPGDESLSWRLDLSRRLHAKYEKNRRCGKEVVSTLHIQQTLDILEEYYNYLVDDYNVIVSPVCSKMQTVASYLFWERYGEIQLSFPIPISYDITRKPTGIGKINCVELYAQAELFRRAF